MQLTVLGKYGPFPAALGATSSYLISDDKTSVLVDCGSGALSRLQRYLGVLELDAIILSHLHYDHIADMLVLRYCLEAYRKHGDDISPIPVYMPDKPEREASLLRECPLFDVRCVENGEKISIGKTGVEFCAMTHPVPSYAIKMVSGGRALVYSGDTTLNSSIVPFASGADTLLMDCAILSRDHGPASPHVSAAQAGEIALKAGASQMIVTHLFPYYDENEVRREAARGFEGAILAQELKTYEI